MVVALALVIWIVGSIPVALLVGATLHAGAQPAVVETGRPSLRVVRGGMSPRGGSPSAAA